MNTCGGVELVEVGVPKHTFSLSRVCVFSHTSTSRAVKYTLSFLGPCGINGPRIPRFIFVAEFVFAHQRDPNIGRQQQAGRCGRKTGGGKRGVGGGHGRQEELFRDRWEDGGKWTKGNERQIKLQPVDYIWCIIYTYMWGAGGLLLPLILRLIKTAPTFLLNHPASQRTKHFYQCLYLGKQ